MNDLLDDEIRSASDSELLRLHRSTLLRNYKGRLDARLESIVAEIKRRSEIITGTGKGEICKPTSH